jgi:hypothetical protein
VTHAGAALRILALTGLMAALPLPASAEWHLTPLVGFTFKGGTSIVDVEAAAAERQWFWGGNVTLIGAGPVGVESVFVYVPGFFESDGNGVGAPPPGQGPVGSRTLAWMGNVVLATPRAWNEYGLRPFVSGGLGVLNATIDQQPESPLLPVRETLVAFNLGGGATGFFTDRVGVRFDLRYFANLPRDEELSDDPVSFGTVRLRYWTASIGVVFRR